jgi:type I restriction enzyme S subunit
MSQDYEMPERWELKTLGDVAKFQNGNGFSKSDWEKDGLRIIRIQNLTGSNDKINYYSGDVDERYHIYDGDILLSWSATLEVFEWQRGHALLNQHIYNVKPYNSEKKFIYYLLKWLLEDIESHTHGSTMKHITKKKLLSIEVPIPPLEEQKAIVEKLEEIFYSIDEIQDAQEQAEEIYQNLAFSYFTSRVRDSETNLVSTGELIEDSQYGTSNATNSEGDGYPTLRMGNYDLRGNMDYSKIKYQDLDEDEFEKYKANKGDVLFNRTNSKDLVGKMCIYDGGLEDAVFASYLIRVELNEEKVLPEYFVTYMNSHLGEIERQGKLKQAVSQANINATELREMEMKVPSLEKQREIVSSLDYMRSKTDDIMADVERKGDLADDLPKSVLTEAFKGDLVDFEVEDELKDKSDSSEHELSEDSKPSFDGEGQQSFDQFN